MLWRPGSEADRLLGGWLFHGISVQILVFSPRDFQAAAQVNRKCARS